MSHAPPTRCGTIGQIVEGGETMTLLDAAKMVCERYDATGEALVRCADADLEDPEGRSCAAVASVIHLRAMDYFLLGKGKHKPDDVICTDFATGYFRGGTTPLIVRLGNKRIAHITVGASGSGGLTYWDPRGHLELLVEEFGRFVRMLDPERATWFSSTHDRWSKHPLLSDDAKRVEMVPTFTGRVITFRIHA